MVICVWAGSAQVAKNAAAVSTNAEQSNQGITEEQVRQKYIDQVPMKRGCTYNDICNVVAFLASEQSSYMTGQAINVTGGQEMH